MKPKIDTLLQQEFTRKQFLATLGLGLAAVFGFSNLIQYLTTSGTTVQSAKETKGFGSGVYGGGA